MSAAPTLEPILADQDLQISRIVARERARLRSFIRRRVADPGDVDDILQEVFYELVEATRLLKPIEHVGAWLFRVARNRIIDRFRRRTTEPIAAAHGAADPDAASEPPAELEELLPSAEGGPDAQYARRLLLEELDSALEELPAAQREVFLAHEIDGRSFREMALESGLSINTLLARKRYAVLHLRERLRSIYQEIPWNEEAKS